VPRRRLVLLTVILGLTVAACATAHPPNVVDPTNAPHGPQSTVNLVVPPGEGGGPLSTPRQLVVPPGWTAQVWARVPGARMEAWTPEGNLLVSQPGAGSIVELTPNPKGVPASRTLLSGLTGPQGMAFASVGGQWVLYVGEYNKIDRYPWAAGGISGARTVIAGNLDPPTGLSTGHPSKDVAVAPNGMVYFNVGSQTNADPVDRTGSSPRAVIMAVNPDGTNLHVVERGVRNGEGVAVAPDGSVWTAVNNRDNIAFPYKLPFGGATNALGKVFPVYVNDHPPDEVAPVTAGRDLGWPYCNPDQDLSKPSGSLANVPMVADSVTNPGGARFNCSALPNIEVGIPAHSAPLGLTFLETSTIPAPWSDGAVVAVHGSWNRSPPRPPEVLWMPWDAVKHTLQPAVAMVSGFQYLDGSRWGRPVDAVPSPDGDLYISDDLAGAIYRLVPPA
jgi:glucose/arabinose dehydrogenase